MIRSNRVRRAAPIATATVSGIAMWRRDRDVVDPGGHRTIPRRSADDHHGVPGRTRCVASAARDRVCGQSDARRHGDRHAGARRSVLLDKITNESGGTGGTVTVRLALEPESPDMPQRWERFLGLDDIVGLSPPSGNEHLKITGRVLLPSPLPPDTITGLQLLVGWIRAGVRLAHLRKWSARTLAIPAGGVGTGCDPRDGWTSSKNGASRRYRNFSDALSLPDAWPGPPTG